MIGWSWQDWLPHVIESIEQGEFEMAGIKRSPEIESEIKARFARISKADWAELYFDLYRQTCGDELASDEECMQDAEKRLDILKIYRKAGQ